MSSHICVPEMSFPGPVYVSAPPSLWVVLEQYARILCPPPSLLCPFTQSQEHREPTNSKLKGMGTIRLELGPMQLRILGRGGPEGNST